MSENILDIIKASQLPQVNNPDPSVYRLLISNNDNLRTAPLYFITEKIQEALDAANGAYLFGGSLVPDIEEANEKALLAYNWANETRDMTFDGDGYFDTLRLKSASIEAKHLMIGTRSQQFSLPNVKFAFSSDFLTLNYSAGKISHLTIDPDGITEWTISAGSISLTSAYHYIFVKAVKGGTTATIIGSTTPIKVEEVPGFYHFEVGYTSSIAEGIRLFKTNYGFAQINPAEISIGRIADPTGANYIQLGQTGIDIVAGSVVFRSPSTGGYKDLGEEYDDINDNLDSLNLVRDYVNNLLPQELQGLQDQIDGVVDDWYYPHSPTSGNLPASDWTTLQLKKDHEGDRFTNTQPFVDEATTPDSGKQWRWLETSTNVFEWVLIPNSEGAIALNRANEAFDLADGKRRIFVAQPFPPYDIGDMWVQGEAGDIMRCATARLSGSYVAADWVKASKYTDDARAILAETNAKQYADTLKGQTDNEIGQVNQALTDFETEVNGIFKTGVIGEAEALSIERYKNTLAVEKSDVDARYNLVYDNTQLTGTPKTDLLAKKNAYNTAHTNLINAINTAIADGKADAQDVQNVDNAFTAYRTALSNLSTSFETAINAIAQAKADKALSDANAHTNGLIAIVNQDVLDVDTRVNGIQDLTNTAFRDNVIDLAERESIRTVLKNLETELSDVTARYDEVYNDAQLENPAKQELFDTKALFDTKIANYTTAINNAIADENVSPSENVAVAVAFGEYKTASANLQKAFEGAIRTIEDNKSTAVADQAREEAEAYIDQLAQYNLELTKALLDGAISDEERKTLELLEAQAEEQREYVQSLLNGTSIGAKNILREYDVRFQGKYWGGTVLSNEVDIDTLDPITGFVISTEDNEILLTENNNQLTISWL